MLTIPMRATLRDGWVRAGSGQATATLPIETMALRRSIIRSPHRYGQDRERRRQFSRANTSAAARRQLQFRSPWHARHLLPAIDLLALTPAPPARLVRYQRLCRRRPACTARPRESPGFPASKSCPSAGVRCRVFMAAATWNASSSSPVASPTLTRRGGRAACRAREGRRRCRRCAWYGARRSAGSPPAASCRAGARARPGARSAEPARSAAAPWRRG